MTSEACLLKDGHGRNQGPDPAKRPGRVPEAEPQPELSDSTLEKQAP